MLRFDPQSAAWLSPSLIAAAAAALLFAIIGALAVPRRREDSQGEVARVCLILIVAALGGSLTFAYFDSAAMRLNNAERRGLELRAAQLSEQSLKPGSPLACLDALAGETVEAACERAVFASPASVATAIAYVAAQFTLLSQMTAYARSGGTGIDATLLPLRRALEADPFGFLAHVLVRGDGCTSEHCLPFLVLHDPSHVRTNIIAQTLEHYVDHYREVWAKSPDPAVADASDLGPAGLPDAGRRKVSVNVDFPSAASIPPISIMNPEPKGPAERAANSTEAARGRAPGAQADPVWTPAPTPAPAAK
ncbi:MAG TPA: hypothetical protein VMF12_13120 [Xanthobacteraceae bacterium]|nr:hypothetical protein [Xanthobacteraceae bacterium]